MRVFITGATGWVGSATVTEFLAAGHEVVGMVRSEDDEKQVLAKGAVAFRGDLDDLDSLRRGARDADGVVHLANKHDWANPAEMFRAERAAVQTLGDELVGSGRPFIIASAIAGVVQGRPATEDDVSPAVGPESMRGGSENLALSYADRGVRSMIVRFSPSVHGEGDRGGFVASIVRAAKQRGLSAYIGEGQNAWSAVHRVDTARLIRLGVEKASAGTRLHAVAEEAVTTFAIAEAIGEEFSLPVTSVAAEDAVDHFGFTGRFFAMDVTGTSQITRESMGWNPAGATLLEDIGNGGYQEL